MPTVGRASLQQHTPRCISRLILQRPGMPVLLQDEPYALWAYVIELSAIRKLVILNNRCTAKTS